MWYVGSDPGVYVAVPFYFARLWCWSMMNALGASEEVVEVVVTVMMCVDRLGFWRRRRHSHVGQLPASARREYHVV